MVEVSHFHLLDEAGDGSASQLWNKHMNVWQGKAGDLHG